MIIPKFDDKWEWECDEVGDFIFFFRGKLSEDYLKWKQGEFVSITIDLAEGTIDVRDFETGDFVEKVKIKLVLE